MLRIVSIQTLGDPNNSYGLALFAIWTNLEPMLGIMNASFPVIWPLICLKSDVSIWSWARSLRQDNSNGSRRALRPDSQQSYPSPKARPGDDFEQLNEDHQLEMQFGVYQTVISGTSSRRDRRYDEAELKPETGGKTEFVRVDQVGGASTHKM